MRRSARLLTYVMASVALTTQSAAQKVDIGSGSVVTTVARLKAGQYVWEPQVAPSGPMLLIVNTHTQRAVLFRNGVPIAATTISTGRRGRETPRGVFTVLEKQVVHHSSKYDNAPMPYMQRLTWYGVALHAGHLPGYPASHGCIRMPAGFAKLLYGVTTLGMTVVITDHATQPRLAPTPAIIASPKVAEVPKSAEQIEWNPGKAPSGPVSIVVSASDGRAVVLRNGVEIGSAPVAVGGSVTGTWAYALRDVDAQGQHWMRIPLNAGDAPNVVVPRTEWERFKAPPQFRLAVRDILQPGATIVVTADSLRSGAVAEPVTVMEGGEKAN